MSICRRDVYMYMRCLYVDVISICIRDVYMYAGCSTETVAFQVYEILKIDHEFLQFF